LAFGSGWPTTNGVFRQPEIYVEAVPLRPLFSIRQPPFRACSVKLECLGQMKFIMGHHFDRAPRAWRSRI